MKNRILFATLMTLALLGTLQLLSTRFNPSRAIAAPNVWPTISFTSKATGLVLPTTVTHAGDNSGRIFVTERGGIIRVIKNNTVLSTPFLNIGATGANRISTGGPEEGLLGLAFAPGYGANNDRFYIYYTNLSGNLVIARYRVTANADVADVNSEQIILTVPHPTNLNHNGGQLAFGPDGYLYIGTGDGGSGGDPPNNAQNPAVLLGKILRVNVEFPVSAMPSGISQRAPLAGIFEYLFPLIAKAPPSPPVTYTIPATNPFTQTVGYRGEIWALGLRNPWRFSFDRQTGDLYIGDVGQNNWEEVDFQSASSAGGENYGWRILEGTHCYPSGTPSCVPPTNYSAPVAEYSHASGCSVTGGYVFRGPGNAAMQGIYFYGDYCSSRIWGLQNSGGWQTQQLAQPGWFISTFGEDQDGNLYVARYDTGVLYQITTP